MKNSVIFLFLFLAIVVTFVSLFDGMFRENKHVYKPMFETQLFEVISSNRKFDDGKMTGQWTLKNIGNISGYPKIQIFVRDKFGTLAHLESFALTKRKIAPGDTIRFSKSFSGFDKSYFLQIKTKGFEDENIANDSMTKGENNKLPVH